jgi:Ubiquitinol-cytochrome C reductase Fe-S subunit TAT signal
MEQPTRRGFLFMTGAGAAAVGAAAFAAGRAGTGDGPAEVAPAAAAAPTGSGPLVAYVADAGSGRVSVMVGETETIVHDPELVARLTRAAAGRRA